MTRKILPTASAGLLALIIPVAAFANFSVGDSVGTDLDEIRATFEAQGYTVTEIEVEDGEIEVEYLLDGVEWEATVGPDTGRIIEVKEDD